MGQFRALNLSSERCNRIINEHGQGPAMQLLLESRLHGVESIIAPFQAKCKEVRENNKYGERWEQDQIAILQSKAKEELAKLNETEALKDNITRYQGNIINDTYRARGKNKTQPDAITAIQTFLYQQEVRANAVRIREQSRKDHEAMVANWPSDVPLPDDKRQWVDPVNKSVLEASQDYDQDKETYLSAFLDAPTGTSILPQETAEHARNLISRKVCAPSYEAITSCQCRLVIDGIIERAIEDMVVDPLFHDPILTDYIPISDQDRGNIEMPKSAGPQDQ